MPRPGPRPYECVRRAWHSDRHQPMRGSIIQQIFRVVNETHGSLTKKNKEWQEKLPIVVLKAEEILYSKANSEAEYLDLDTLWDRLNDAINTIIRRDETAEIGIFLQPCIEAALNLGCVAVKASRSQRHSNPRSYLQPRAQEPASVPPRVLENTTRERFPQLLPRQTGNQFSFARPTKISESNVHIMHNNNTNAPLNFPFTQEYASPSSGFNQLGNDTSANFSSVYPLYYGTHFRAEESQLRLQASENSNSNTIYVGTPVIPSTTVPAKMGVLQNLFPFDGLQDNSRRSVAPDVRDPYDNRAPRCDLSLRLGPYLDPYEALDTKSIGLTTVPEGSTLPKEFSFFPSDVESCSIRQNPEEAQIVEESFR